MNKKDIVILTIAGVFSLYAWSLIVGFMYGPIFIFAHYIFPYDENRFFLAGLLSSISSVFLILFPFAFFLKRRSLLHGGYFIIVFLTTATSMMYIFSAPIEYKDNITSFFQSFGTQFFILFSVLFLWCPLAPLIPVKRIVAIDGGEYLLSKAKKTWLGLPVALTTIICWIISILFTPNYYPLIVALLGTVFLQLIGIICSIGEIKKAMNNSTEQIALACNIILFGISLSLVLLIIYHMENVNATPHLLL